MAADARQTVLLEAGLEGGLAVGHMLIEIRLVRGPHSLQQVLLERDISRQEAALSMRVVKLFAAIQADRDLSYRQAVTLPGRIAQLVRHLRDRVWKARRLCN